MEGVGEEWGLLHTSLGFPLFRNTPEETMGLTTSRTMLSPLSAVLVCKVLQYLGQRKKESSNTLCPVQPHIAHQIFLFKNRLRTIKYIIYKTLHIYFILLFF